METDTEHVEIRPKRAVVKRADQTLWSDVQNGSEEALAELFRQYYSRLFNYGYKIIPNREFIMDCVQELFLTIWDRKNYLNEAYSINSYLFSSMRRVIFRKLKKQNRIYERNKKYIDTCFQEVLNAEDLIVHFEIENECKKKLKLAMKLLGGRQREAIYLKFYDGLSNDEISEIMGINHQSVYNHISGAIQRLQEFVK